jgi:NDP-sugar pyrophosphorylase family protein
MTAQKKLNIVVPMAGAGSRFAVSGYKDPKPLIKVNGVEMVRLVIENLRPRVPHRFIFICQQAHLNAYGLNGKLAAWAPDCEVIGLNGLTEGAACTVLTARSLIDGDEPLMIANSDQYIDASIDDYLGFMEQEHLDGLIMTMKAHDPKWSFVGLDPHNMVTRVVEKKVISDEATVGIYNFRRGADFVAAGDAMIAQNLRVNNEFYVAPTYNPLIESGYRVGIYNVGSEAQGMYGLGTPDDLQVFLSLPVHQQATQGL